MRFPEWFGDSLDRAPSTFIYWGDCRAFMNVRFMTKPLGVCLAFFIRFSGVRLFLLHYRQNPGKTMLGARKCSMYIESRCHQALP